MLLRISEPVQTWRRGLAGDENPVLQPLRFLAGIAAESIEKAVFLFSDRVRSGEFHRLPVFHPGSAGERFPILEVIEDEIFPVAIAGLREEVGQSVFGNKEADVWKNP